MVQCEVLDQYLISAKYQLYPAKASENMKTLKTLK